jgi:hypothetical protein
LYLPLLSPLCAAFKWLFCCNELWVVLIVINVLFRAKFESVKCRSWTLICDAFKLKKCVHVIGHMSVRWRRVTTGKHVDEFSWNSVGGKIYWRLSNLPKFGQNRKINSRYFTWALACDPARISI